MIKTLLVLLVMLSEVACTIIAPPPQELLAKNDHAALAVCYEKEAANLRQKAREMEVMIEEYRKDRERGRKLMIHPPKTDFVQECHILAAMYRNAARQAESLATSYREMTRA